VRHDHQVVRVATLTACVVLAGCAAEPAQQPEPSEPRPSWVRSAGDGATQFAYGVALDGAGNTYVIGEYGGTIDLGTGALGNAATTSGFVAKLDRAGNPGWSRRIGGSGDASAYAVAVDDRGHVLIGGWFRGDLEGRKAAGETDAYLLELDSDGTTVGLRTFGDAGSQTITAIAVHGDEVVIAGDFDGSIDLGGGPLASAGQSDVFVASFAAGRHRFSARFGGPDHDRRPRLAVNQTAIYLAATYRGEVAVGAERLPDAYDGAFVARFSREGAIVWSKPLAGDGWCFPTSLALSPRGELAIGARFSKSIASPPVVSESGEDALLITLDETGAVRFAERYGGFGRDAISAVGYAGDDLFIAGELQVSLGSLVSVGGADAFIGRVRDGRIAWIEGFGDGADQRLTRMAVDPRGGVVLAGNYFGSLALAGRTVRSNGGFDASGGDVFIASLGPAK